MSQRHARIDLFTTLIYDYINEHDGVTIEEIKRRFPLIQHTYIDIIIIQLQKTLEIYKTSSSTDTQYFTNELPF